MNLFSALKKVKQFELTTPDAPNQLPYQLLDNVGDNIGDVKLMPGDDEGYMARALQLARKGIYTAHPNPVVGCVIVNQGNIVGQGWHEFAGQDHAEVKALRQAGKAAAGATLYVTLEPCSHQGKTPPCVKAIIKAAISRVVIAIEDPDPRVNRSGISALQHAGIEVTLGIGRVQASHLNRGFLKRIASGMPWVTLKIATSLDGKTAMADGESQWITSPPARQDAHKLRAAASAILTGVGTVLRDDPNMTARLSDVQRQPLRIILDTNLSTPVEANILRGAGAVLIVTAHAEDHAATLLRQHHAVEIINCRTAYGKIDLHEVMRELGRREMNSILLEAGARLSGSMLAQGLVDEIVVYMAADLLGGDARDMFKIPGLEHIADKLKLSYKDVVMVGRDLKLTLAIDSDDCVEPTQLSDAPA